MTDADSVDNQTAFNLSQSRGRPYDGYSDGQMLDMIWLAAMPSWTMVAVVAAAFGALFIIGLIGNCMVIFVVLRNEAMRSTTNLFLVNLAVADFLLLIFCLPPTMIWEVSKTWWFSTNSCKATLYLQHVTVAVSVLTMMAISVERYLVVARPLQVIAKSNTWAIKTLVVVWVCGLLLGLPEPLSLQKRNYDFSAYKTNFTSGWLASCENALWPEYEYVFWTIHTVFLFVMPLCVTGVMYGMVSYVLWIKPQRIQHQHQQQQQQTPPRMKTSVSQHTVDQHDGAQADSAARRYSKRNSIVSIRSHCGGQASGKGGEPNRAKHLDGRRKAAQMLIAVVVLFVICYLPTFIYNILMAYKVIHSVPKHIMDIINMAARFLFYLNSCINPIIYNFMSEKFQREFRRACACCQLRRPRRRAGPSTTKSGRLQTETPRLRIDGAATNGEADRLLMKEPPSSVNSTSNSVKHSHSSPQPHGDSLTPDYHQQNHQHQSTVVKNSLTVTPLSRHRGGSLSAAGSDSWWSDGALHVPGRKPRQSADHVQLVDSLKLPTVSSTTKRTSGATADAVQL